MMIRDLPNRRIISGLEGLHEWIVEILLIVRSLVR